MLTLGPYATLAVLVGMVVGGLILAALGVGWWGHRRALRDGRACSVCGYWGTEIDLLTHACTYREDVRRED